MAQFCDRELQLLDQQRVRLCFVLSCRGARFSASASASRCAVVAARAAASVVGIESDRRGMSATLTQRRR